MKYNYKLFVQWISLLQNPRQAPPASSRVTNAREEGKISNCQKKSNFFRAGASSVHNVPQRRVEVYQHMSIRRARVKLKKTHIEKRILRLRPHHLAAPCHLNFFLPSAQFYRIYSFYVLRVDNIVNHDFFFFFSIILSI